MVEVCEKIDQRPLSLLIQLWHGHIPLPVTFWVYGVGVTVAITMVQFLVTLIPVFGTAFVIILAFIGGLWRILTWVSIWRSADDYIGPRYWAIGAKIIVVIAVTEWGLQIAGVMQHGFPFSISPD